MDRYYLSLFFNEFEYEVGKIGSKKMRKAKNLKVPLFKEEQWYKKDMSDFFTDFQELTEDEKVYASTFLDDLFTEEEIFELMPDLCGDGTRLIIGEKISFPMEYKKDGRIGVVITPIDSSRGYIRSHDFSFPLVGFCFLDQSLIHEDTIYRVLEKRGVDYSKIHKFINSLLEEE